MLQILDDRESEADQCHGCSLPRHHCALKAQAGADPAEMTVRRHPHFEPARSWSHVYIGHGQCPFCRFRLRDLTRGCAAPAARDARGRPANQDIREVREDQRDDQRLNRIERLKTSNAREAAASAERRGTESIAETDIGVLPLLDTPLYVTASRPVGSVCPEHAPTAAVWQSLSPPRQ